eukprot:m.207014 g.207014  ORF g.207014 m.207014 type:complete len:153 (+) comp39688_c1_seq38:173-631(+)
MIIESFHAKLLNGCQLRVTITTVSAVKINSPAVTLLEGHRPLFTVEEKRDYFSGVVAVRFALVAGTPLPNLTLNGTKLEFQVFYQYNYTSAVLGLQYFATASNVLGTYNQTYSIRKLGMNSNCHVISSNPIRNIQVLEKINQLDVSQCLLTH